MYAQTPAEALVTRLLIALNRGELGSWGPRLFAPGATLHVHDRHRRTDLHGPDEIVAKYLNHLPETAGAAVTLADSGATLAFTRAGEPHELSLHVGGGKIDELWSYPATAVPADARAAPVSAHHGGSCCSG